MDVGCSARSLDPALGVLSAKGSGTITWLHFRSSFGVFVRRVCVGGEADKNYCEGNIAGSRHSEEKKLRFEQTGLWVKTMCRWRDRNGC